VAAPGTSGNVLTSNGTNWNSSAPSNATITLSGDLSGSGTTSINAQLGTGVVGSAEINNATDLAMTAQQSIKVTDAATGVTNVLVLGHNTTGTPAANLGASMQFLAESDTTNDRTQGSVATGWTDVADATRTSFLELKAVLNGTQHTSAQGFRLWGSRGATLNRSVDPGQGNMDISGVYETAGSQIGTNDLAASATNDTPAAGKIGQTIASAIVSGSAVSYTTAQTKNLTSISLTAGDWDVRGNVNWIMVNNTANTTYGSTANISTTTGTLPDDGYQSAATYTCISASVTAGFNAPLPPRRISLASTSTIYLVGKAPTFAAGTTTAYGYIEARRVR
jgi:hypothetical protein